MRPATADATEATYKQGAAVLTECLVTERLDLARVLKTFERHRHQLSRQLCGTSGAFAGFNALSFLPAQQHRLTGGEPICARVTTTIRRTSQKTCRFELTVTDESAAVLVLGSGTGIYPSSKSSEWTQAAASNGRNES